MFSALLPLPAATTTIALAGQDVPTWFDQLYPLLALLGIPVAVAILGVIVWMIMTSFDMLVGYIKDATKKD